MSGIIISSLLAVLLVSAMLKPFVYANFDCVCSNNGTKFVYAEPNSDSDIIGVLRRDVCKAVLTWNETSTRWATIAYLHQTGHVEMDNDQHKRECYGDPQAKDVVPSSTQPRTTTTPPTTTTTTPSTTPTTRSTTTRTTPSTTPTTRSTATTTTTTTIRKPTTTTTTRRPTTQSTNTMRRTTTPSTTTTRRPTTPSTSTTRRTTTPSTTTTRKTTTTTTTQTPTTTKKPFVKGNTNLCPDHAKIDINRQHSILAQYGEFCYELVPQNASWNYSECHCEFRGGHLIRITDQGLQNYIHKFIQQQKITQQVWIGLNDIAKEGEYVWSTGDPVAYTHYSIWHIIHLTHNIADCFVMQSNGEWDDISCGLDKFTTLANSHGNPSICQYSIPSTLPSIVDFWKDVVG